MSFTSQSIGMGSCRRCGPACPGFSLLEVMVSMMVFFLILGVVFQALKSTTDIWKGSASKVSGFSEARGAFEAMTRMISQATLNTYVDYVDSDGNFRTSSNLSSFTPDHYARRSDLHFISGKNLLAGSSITNPVTHSLFFQAPMGYQQDTAYQGMQSNLNACGFFVYYGTDYSRPGFLPNSVPNRSRYRLMQFLQPAENLAIFDSSITNNSAMWNTKDWFLTPLNADTTGTAVTMSQIAENVVALVVLPEASTYVQSGTSNALSSDYEYNSRDSSNTQTWNQLPPVVRILMVVIDESSAVKLCNSSTPPNLGLDSLFQDSSKLDSDLKTLEQNLSAVSGNAAGNKIPVRFEVFQTEVGIPAAKWSD